uniref:claudin-1-like isoform X1 n=1 Tax=Ciona intestinalis TaxID=7719 RepID=UPI00006A3464|nr:claudin-1-like isoform X1 [Ciona intestinalis]|eukprot:XP_026692137.1 claudin-1-like isoform X1 [Ciona intestinalis]
MANACPSVGLALGILSTIGILYSLASKEWKRNSQNSSQNVNRGIYSYEGLWVRCTSPMPGQFQCDNYDESFLALPASLQAQRAMMCIAAIAAVAGIVAGALGLQCIKVMEGSNAKVHTGRAGGGLMFLAGALTIAAVSWYAADVVYQFHVEVITNQSFTYEFGSALYVGWIAGGCALISGALMACCNCGNEETDSYPAYTYKPPKASGGGNNTEYV